MYQRIVVAMGSVAQLITLVAVAPVLLVRAEEA